MLQLPQAVVFDMDGTLIDNYPFHLKAWGLICEKYGAPRSEEAIIRDLHGTNFEVCKNFFGPDVTFEESERIGQEKEALYREIYKPHIQPVDGLIELLETLNQCNIPMAVGTMGNKANADFTLDTLDIRHYFSAVHTAEEVSKGKPDPEIFTKCLVSLNTGDLQGEKLWIFEDTSSGIKAAINAGGTPIGLLTSKSKEELISSGAVYCVKTYHEILKLLS
jgi:HAD superfamily hydrolase (TIGR01509 family)